MRHEHVVGHNGLHGPFYKASESSRKRAIPSSKIVSHASDLSQPWLGLSESAFAAFAGEVDVILHMGAARSFWDNYHLLRASNVSATMRLVKLATAHPVRIHQISSAGVLPREEVAGCGGGGASSVAVRVPPTDGSNGYVASRWASQQILEPVAQTLGLANVDSPLRACHCQPAVRAAQRLLHDDDEAGGAGRTCPVCGRVRADARASGWEGRIGMIPAEQAFRGLCEAVMVIEQANKTEDGAARFAHHECRISLDVAEMRMYVEQQRGWQSHERMPGLRWVGRIKALGFEYLFASQETSVQRTAEREGATKLESRR